MLSLTVLCDNSTIIDSYLLGEPGLSFWIECGDKQWLFDTGYSDVFIRNAGILNIDITKMDGLVYSHGHNDHTWGTHDLVRLFDRTGMKTKPSLIAHPLVFENKMHGDNVIGTMMKADALSCFFDVKLTSEPAELAEGLTWLGEIPEIITARKAVGNIVSSDGESEDFCMDDSALVYESKDGLVIITGCSHSGICNIAEHARNVTGEKRVADIVGGLHLLSCETSRLRETSDYLKSIGIREMHPCHCTDFAAKAALSQEFAIKECAVGVRLEYERV